MQNILIIRMSSLGDIIHTLPAFAALRKNFPAARIAWVVEPKGKDILDFVRGIDEIVVVGSPGWRKKLRNPDQAAFDFQGLLKSGFITRISGSRKRFGFHRKNLKEPSAALFYTDRLEEASETGHVIGKNLRLLRLAGISEDKYEFPLDLPETLRNSMKKKIADIIPPASKQLVLFNVGAAWPTKRWFPESWIAVLNDLKNESMTPLLLWGTPEEETLAKRVNQATGVPLAPFLSVQESLALIKESALVVSGDTFAMQAACALSVPVVGIFGPTTPKRNGPFHSRDKFVYHEIACSSCYKRSCDSMECLKLVTPAEVSAMVRLSLKENA
ncbi:MAG: glycosyltransferase family 9 protein [Candidatus Aminicenantes bacterium]|nr:glycosyltransferase family 9 protein [Candidatus Aminicenantes bacterium]